MHAIAPASAVAGRPDAVDDGARVAPEQDAADPVARDQEPARARAEPELLRPDEDEHEADGGEAEVAERRLRGQERDPAVEERAERGVPVRGRGAVGRAEAVPREREHDRDGGDEDEREPPGDLAQETAEDRREHEAGGLRGRERAHGPPEHIRRRHLRERREEDGERKAFEAPIAARAARNHQMSGANAQPTAATPKPMYPPRTTRRGPRRSASVPETSWRSAKGTMYAVIAAATWPIDASRPSATLGMSATSIAPPNGPRKPPT